MAAAAKRVSSSCSCEVSPDTAASASLALSMFSRARPSAPFASDALPCAWSVAATMSASDVRAPPTACAVSAIWATARDFEASNASRESPIAWSMASAATSLTVDTNAELMVSSRVDAPVSVILGATGPVFSLTWYSILGCTKSPVVRDSRRSVKSGGMTNAA